MRPLQKGPDQDLSHALIIAARYPKRHEVDLENEAVVLRLLKTGSKPFTDAALEKLLSRLIALKMYKQATNIVMTGSLHYTHSIPRLFRLLQHHVGRENIKSSNDIFALMEPRMNVDYSKWRAFRDYIRLLIHHQRLDEAKRIIAKWSSDWSITPLPMSVAATMLEFAAKVQDTGLGEGVLEGESHLLYAANNHRFQNSVLHYYSQMQQYDKAMMYFRQLHRSRATKPDVEQYNVMAHTISKAMGATRSSKILEFMDIINTIRARKRLIALRTKAGGKTKLLPPIKPNLQTYKVLLSEALRQDQIQLGFELLSELKQKNFEADADVFNILLESTMKRDGFYAGYQLFTDTCVSSEKTVVPTAKTYEALLAAGTAEVMLANTLRVAKSKMLLVERLYRTMSRNGMILNGPKVDAILYAWNRCALLDGNSKRTIDKFDDMYRRVNRARIQLRPGTYAMVFKRLLKARRGDVFTIFRDMRRANVEPTPKFWDNCITFAKKHKKENVVEKLERWRAYLEKKDAESESESEPESDA